MRAAIFKAPRAPLEIHEVPDLRPGPGEIVVRVKNCGICSSDLHAANSPTMSPPPGTIMGHEFSGVIEEVGSAVAGFEPGEPAAVMSYLACGECSFCRAGFAMKCRSMRPVGFGEVPGAYAQFITTRPGSVFKMPRQMSFRTGAMVEPMVVALHGLRRSRFQAGETCVIMGAGPIGMMTLLWARFAGARTIVVSEVLIERRELALKLGADFAVDPRLHSPASAMDRLTGSGADVIFECIGSPGSLAQAITYAPRGGRITVLSASIEDDGFPPGIAMSKELDIHFSLGIEPGEIETTIAVLASGRISTEPLITHIVTLDDLPRAFAGLQQPTNQMKVMVEL
jgi:(R,R)-butanediol dehydrogenase/meso-butanediol dehydrogenase/diacetyl reductase